MTEDKNEPTISVIVPAYNVERYITDALNSLEQQTEKPNEIIVIDDGSTDNTANVINKHSLRGRITLIQTVNQGQGIARNIGISIAKSEYIYFFDADDLLVPGFIAGMKIKLGEKREIDIIFFSGEAFNDSQLETRSFYPRGYMRDLELTAVDNSVFLEHLLAAPKLSGSPCLYVSRRSLWSAHNLSFNRYYHEDEEVLFPLIFSARTISITRDVYFLRRIRPESTMTGRKMQRHAEGQAALLASLIKLIQSNRFDKTKDKLLRRRLAHFIQSYMTVSRASRTALDTKLLFMSLIKARSIKAVIKYILYIIKYTGSS
jgi:glycosyltransferase involved in cell wall biosynthesis